MRPDWVKERKPEDVEAEENQLSSRPSGFTRRGSEREEAREKPRKTRTYERKPESREESAPPKRKRKSKNRKPRPLEIGSISLGVVHVMRATEKGLQITGGDTDGDHWIPRSYVLDGENPGDIDRDSEVGDRGELWLPEWLADKIPW